MAIKPSELLNQLPSVSDLLEKPPVRALADRWNRSVVASGVRSFLDEMRSEVRRRTGEMPLPTIRELAERAAQYIVAQQQPSLGAAINATGQLRGSQWMNSPLSDAALERSVAVGREFVLQTSHTTAARALDVEASLCRLTGATAATVVHSYPGALWLALSTFAAGRDVLVARTDVGEIELDEPLPKLAAAANVSLREVGTINRAVTADFEAMASPSTAAILRITPDAYRIVGDTTAAEPESLVALCRDRELRLIDALGVAPLTEPPESIQLPLPSVRERLASGVDLAIVRGDGLVGGPACGILLGDRDIIQEIKGHPLFAAWRLDVLRNASLIATLESYDNKPLGPEELPMWQFLTGSIENLHNRAERLAPQLAAASGISTATAIEIRSPLLPAFTEGWPSYGVALTAADGDIRSLDKRLRSGPLPILGRMEGERLILDLRTVLPRQDKSIVDVLLEAPPLGEENASQNGSTP